MIHHINIGPGTGIITRLSDEYIGKVFEIRCAMLDAGDVLPLPYLDKAGNVRMLPNNTLTSIIDFCKENPTCIILVEELYQSSIQVQTYILGTLNNKVFNEAIILIFK